MSIIAKQVRDYTKKTLEVGGVNGHYNETN